MERLMFRITLAASCRSPNDIDWPGNNSGGQGDLDTKTLATLACMDII
jgi:hypothetical protein